MSEARLTPEWRPTDKELDAEIKKAIPILKDARTDTLDWAWFRGIAKHFYEQGQKELAKELHEWMWYGLPASGQRRMEVWLRQKGLLDA